MILVDTAIWIDHFRSADAILQDLLRRAQVLQHPFVVGELAMGVVTPRADVLGFLNRLPKAIAADDNEVMRFVDVHRLYGIGIGYIDSHLLAAVRLTPSASLWTRDRRLRAAAEQLSLAAKLGH